MLGFSMITLGFLIAGMLALFFFAVVAASFRYEKAKRDERHVKPKRDHHDRLILSADGELIDFPAVENAPAVRRIRHE